MGTDEAQLRGVWKLDVPRGRGSELVLTQQQPPEPGLSTDGGAARRDVVTTRFLVHGGADAEQVWGLPLI